jgi:NitT/TauT family transport system substrate-binding protein
MTALSHLRLNQGDPTEGRVYYCAHFVAAELGYFAEAGVAVTFVSAASGGQTIRGGQLPALLDGSADLAIGGPMVVMRMAEENAPRLVSFCAAAAANPWALVARAAEPGFALTELEGRQVLDIARIGTATLTFQWLLRRHGVSARLEPGSGNETADIAAVASGAVAYGLHSLHGLGPALADGRVVLVADLAGPTGPVPWSAYIARPEQLASAPAAFDGFTRAIARALAWIGQHDAGAIAGLVGRHYPGYPPAGLRAAIAGCQSAGVFATSPLIARAAHDHFARILTDIGWLTAPTPHDRVVVTRHAEAISGAS